ncbi:hypothetical protein V8V75_25815, partial [Peribacillus frigoritolerans]|uniref:hypothetical protein n=1 Tax=Peribacillus frigoritolerans TaxID=450367 RepID=UPI00300BE8D3
MESLIINNVPDKQLENPFLKVTLSFIKESLPVYPAPINAQIEVFYLSDDLEEVQQEQVPAEFLFKIQLVSAKYPKNKYIICELVNRYKKQKMIYILSDYEKDYVLEDRIQLKNEMEKIINDYDYDGLLEHSNDMFIQRGKLLK